MKDSHSLNFVREFRENPVGMLKTMWDRFRDVMGASNSVLLWYLVLSKDGFQWWMWPLIFVLLVYTIVDQIFIYPRQMEFIQTRSKSIRKVIEASEGHKDAGIDNNGIR